MKDHQETQKFGIANQVPSRTIWQDVFRDLRRGILEGDREKALGYEPVLRENIDASKFHPAPSLPGQSLKGRRSGSYLHGLPERRPFVSSGEPLGYWPKRMSYEEQVHKA